MAVTKCHSTEKLVDSSIPWSSHWPHGSPCAWERCASFHTSICQIASIETFAASVVIYVIKINRCNNMYGQRAMCSWLLSFLATMICLGVPSLQGWLHVSAKNVTRMRKKQFCKILTLTQIQSGLQAQWRFNRAEFDCVVRITCLLRNMQIKHSIDIHITIFYATSLRGRRRTKLWIVSDSSGFLRITIDA